MNDRRILQFLVAARGDTIAVCGDLMLDEWIIGSTTRISPEAPVPVVCFSERKTAPGGAANVAANALQLGATVRVCGVVGCDEAGADLQRELQQAGAETGALVQDESRPTTLKTRIVAQRQQMVRVDRESNASFSAELLNNLQQKIPVLLHQAKVLCISDYDKGIAAMHGEKGTAQNIVQTLIEAARVASMPITGGPKPQNLSCFTGADFLSFNEKEAMDASGIRFDSQTALERAGTMLRERTQARALAITRGARGALLFEESKAPRSIAAHGVEVFDVAGAGDTFLAAATVALAGGADFVEASLAGNVAAAASVRHVGVVAVTLDDVRRVAEEGQTIPNAER